jgi:hypothetical protein
MITNQQPQQPRSLNIQRLEEHFALLETKVHALGELIVAARSTTKEPSPSETREQNLARARVLLTQRGEVTVADLRQGMHVSVKTATRLMHALAHAHEGHLFYEPVGHTARLVLIQPDRVALDRSRPN